MSRPNSTVGRVAANHASSEKQQLYRSETEVALEYFFKGPIPPPGAMEQ
jgi:hypothetical protein